MGERLMATTIRAQADAVTLAALSQRAHVENLRGLVVHGRRPQTELDLATAALPPLQAAAATMSWFVEHEAEIKAFVALPAETRATLLAHHDLVLLVQRQVESAERAAKSGGPLR